MVDAKTFVKNTIWHLKEEKAEKEKAEAWIDSLERNVEKACNLAKGANDIPLYYVISRDNKVGLFSYVETTLRQVAYAIENGMIPIVDMRWIPNSYVDDSELDSINMWSLYFEQPVVLKNEKELFDRLLTDDHSGFVFSNDDNMSKVPYRGKSVYYDRSRWFWGMMYERFFRLNENSAIYFQKEYDDIMASDGSDVLGVLVRGTDFKYANGHNIQPEMTDVVKRAEKFLSTSRYNRIYLATDEYSTEKLFKEYFGDDKILTNKRVYFDGFDFSKGLTINDVSFNRENDKYLRGMEYLSSIMLLSKCKGLIGGMCGGSVAAFYINNGQYKDVDLVDLGMSKG